ncbi:MAG: hypothetical protein GY742_15105 [Hyphomicrobiales bacterium]|nr:hypothetical protein [Hyphomicrobiales bacterium]
MGSKISVDRNVYQTGVSSANWQLTAVIPFSPVFFCQKKDLFEKISVWITRLGLAIGLPYSF